MSNQTITQAWESAPEAALAVLKLEPLYQGLSWFVQQELQRYALHLKGAQAVTTQGMDRMILTGTLSSDPVQQRLQIEAQLAAAARRAEKTAISESRDLLIKQIPVAQKVEIEARKKVIGLIAAEQELIERTQGKLPAFVASSERRIAALIAGFHATYTKPEFKEGSTGLEKLPYPALI